MIKRIWSWVYPVLIVGFVLTVAAVLGVKASQNSESITAQQAENKAQDGQISSLVDSLSDANKKLSSAGLPTVPVIVSPSSGKNGDDGRDGKDGRSVLSTDCGPGGIWQVTYDDGSTANAGGGCIGQAGVNGVDGASITGDTGPAGQNGQDSTVPGPQGPAGAASTVPGPQGSQGVGVTNVTCVALADGTTALEFTLVNPADSTTTTKDVPASCTPQVPPTDGDSQ